ncbi:MAG: hypothetical protein ONB06_04100 [candidate division KSB1 bacterium]|nr:hypothetical protein [candidate division KSB1 bacterium]
MRLLVQVIAVLALLGLIGCGYLPAAPIAPTQAPWIIMTTPVPGVTSLPPPIPQLPPTEPRPLEQPPGEVQITFTADRTNVQPGQCAILQWNVQGGFGVNLNGQPVERAGQKQVCPPESMLYRLGVDVGATVLTRDVTIVVAGGGPPSGVTSTPSTTPSSGCLGAPVIASFTANPSTIAAGQSSTLTWGAVTNATSVSIDQGIGGVATPGSTTVSPVQTTTYTLTATGCGGTTTKQVTINVSGFAITPLPVAPSPTRTPIIAHIISADLAVTDIFPETLPQGKVFLRITNHGPDNLTNAEITFQCSQSYTPVSGLGGGSGATPPLTIKNFTLQAGQTIAHDTGLTVNTNQFKYQITCSVSFPFDPKSANDTYSENIPP